MVGFGAECFLVYADSIQNKGGIYLLLSHYIWSPRVKKNVALIVNLVNFDGFPQKMHCGSGRSLCCSHVYHGSGNF